MGPEWLGIGGNGVKHRLDAEFGSPILLFHEPFKINPWVRWLMETGQR